jgi:hypothetical protein
MTIPTLGAGPSSVAVPVHEAVPTTEVGLTLRLDSTGGFTISEADDVEPASEAVIDTVTTDATAVVLTLNVTLDFPAPTGTLAGKVAAELLLASLITNPPVGGTPVNVIVPVEGSPPTTVPGARVTCWIVAGFTVSTALPELPVIVAPIVAVI